MHRGFTRCINKTNLISNQLKTLVMEKLTITNLACKRGSNLVFDNLSFEIKSGETFLIKGSNGSGKTSLMRTMAGFIKPYEGKIFIDNEQLNADRNDKEKFQFIGEKSALKNNLSVKNNITLWSLLFNTSVNVDDLLKVFNLNSFINSDVATLSDGQKKRLSLSKLFLDNRSVWLLDEPYVFLDEENIVDLNNKILKFNERSGIVIITSNIDIDFPFNERINL
jgi:heme exporter protein A